MINKYQPYKVCVGRKYRVIRKLYKPFIILIGSNLCNQHLIEKNKVKFINQIFRWFAKSRWGYNIKHIKSLLNDYNYIQEGDSIIICSRTQKAAWKNLLLKLGYEISDYDYLKKRQYILNFKFLFLNIIDNLNNIIFLDIVCKNYDMYEILIIVNGFYIENFNTILYYNKNLIYDKIYYNSISIKELNDSYFSIFYSNIDFNNYDYINEILSLEKKK